MKYYVRGTYTGKNTDFAADVLHLAEAGFKHVSVEPVVASTQADYAITRADVPAILAEYEKLAEALLKREKEGNPLYFFHFELDPTGGPCLARRVTGCGAGSEYLAVTPKGRLFPCHQFVGDDDYCLGDLDQGVVKQDLVKAFSESHVFNKPECMNCWARYYCSGGCMATAFHANGNLNTPDEISCDLQRKRIECGLYIFSSRS